MRIIIDKRVRREIFDFYDAAMQLHPSLSWEAVSKKAERLYSELNSLADYYTIYPKARLKKEWVEAGWQEFVCEDFHFAFEVCMDEQGRQFIWIHDAVHSLLYH